MAAQYPTVDIGGPQPLKILRAQPRRAVISKQFKDLGYNYGLLSANYEQEWTLLYDGLTEAQAATLDAHEADAQGSFEGFDFRDPQTTTLHNNVHYIEVIWDHTKRWSQSREIRLRKSPIS